MKEGMQGLRVEYESWVEDSNTIHVRFECNPLQDKPLCELSCIPSPPECSRLPAGETMAVPLSFIWPAIRHHPTLLCVADPADGVPAATSTASSAHIASTVFAQAASRSTIWANGPRKEITLSPCTSGSSPVCVGYRQGQGIRWDRCTHKQDRQLRLATIPMLAEVQVHCRNGAISC